MNFLYASRYELTIASYVGVGMPLPARVAKLDAIAARIENKKLPPGKEPTGPIIDGLVNFDAEAMKKFARFGEHFRAHVEGMMQTAILLDGSYGRIFTLAKENIVISEF